MLKLQLYIEGEQIEFFDDESITLTQSIQDVKDIKKVFYDYSRTFSVPASKNNNKIFKHFYNYFIDGFDARKKKDAQLFINYKPFKKGKIKLEGTTLKNNEAHTYKITFFGNTVSLPDKLKDDKLTVLAELAAFDFSYTDANIITGMTEGFDAVIGDEEIENAIIFPLITHTSRLTYDSTTTGLNNIYPANDNDNGVQLNELKPALKIYAIIKAIELHYSINFSRDFFNPTSDVFTNLYMWLHTKAGSMFKDQGDAHQVTGWQIMGGGQSIKGVTKKNASINFDNPKNNQKYEMYFTLTPSLSTAKYNLVINKNGEEFKRFDNLTGTTTNGAGSNTDSIDIENGDLTVFIESSDANTINCEILVHRKGFGLNVNLFGVNQKNQMLIQAFTNVLSNKPITVVSQLPDITVIDFLTGLFKTYNLTSFIDSDNIIQVQTLDDFYSSSTNNWNLTDHVVTDKSQVDSVIPYRQVDLSYKGLSTFLAENFKQINHKEWGTLEFEKTSKFEGSKYSIELPFEHALYEKLINAGNGDETTIQWGWIVDKSQEPTDTLPLLFYANTPASGSIRVVKINGNRQNIDKPFMPMNSSGFFTQFNKTNKTQSLNFHAETDEYALKPNKNTLFKTYYEDYIVDLFDVRKRITKLAVFLPSHIMQKLSLADIIVVFDKQYRINKITTDFKTGKSELELTNLLEKFVSRTRTLIVNECLLASSDIITADNTIFNADNSCGEKDGFDIPIEKTEIPDPIDKNDAQSKYTDCEVKPASIQDVQNDIQNTSINFKHLIVTKGFKCGQANIDEFGFLLSDTSSNLTASNDIDVLKANVEVTAVSVVKNLSQPSLAKGVKNADINGLSAGTTKFARFYVRTNIDLGFDKADVLSELMSGTTPAIPFSITETNFEIRQAGFGADFGYDTIPTHAQIRNKNTVNNFGTDCGTVTNYGVVHHNGSSALPEIGDRVKVIGQFNDYSGGVNSWTDLYAGSKYFALAVFTIPPGAALTITKHIVVEFSNATVVAIYSCP